MSQKSRVEKLEKERGKNKPSRLFVTYDGKIYTSEGETFTHAEVENYQALTGIEPTVINVKYDEPKEKEN